MNENNEQRKGTTELLNELINSGDFTAFYDNNIEDLQAPNLAEYLKELCESKKIAPHELVKTVDINRMFGYQIFEGERKASRDYILKLAVGLGLTVEETQRLLNISKNSQLYPRVPRDAAIIYCLNNGMGYNDTQAKLHEWGILVLGGDNKYDKLKQ